MGKTVIWTAGVAPSPAGKWLNAKTDRAGRVRVESNLHVAGTPKYLLLAIQLRSIKMASLYRVSRKWPCNKGATLER